MAAKPPDGTHLFGLGHDVLPIEDPNTLDHNRTKYVCAICYQDLQVFTLAEGNITALMCPDVECSGHGFVTRTHARAAKTKARMDLHNAHLDLAGTPFESQLEDSGHKPERLTEEMIRRLLGF